MSFRESKEEPWCKSVRMQERENYKALKIKNATTEPATNLFLIFDLQPVHCFQKHLIFFYCKCSCFICVFCLCWKMNLDWGQSD